MLKKGLKWLQCSLLFLAVAFLTGCGQQLVDGVMETFMKNDERINTFYGECVISQYMGDELLTETSFKEWKGKAELYRIDYDIKVTDKYREAIENGKLEGSAVSGKEIDITRDNKITVYVPENDTYYIKPISLADQINPSVLQGINEVIYFGGLKEYVLSSINYLSDSHDISIIDNVMVNGYTTQQIIAIPKPGNESEDTIEMWVDQDSWMTVKKKLVYGNITMVSEYKHFEINRPVDESVFEVNIPEGANIIELGDNLETVNKEVTLKEATELLGIPIMYLKENSDIKLKSIKYIEISNEPYPKVMMTYDIQGKEIIIEISPAYELRQYRDVGYEKIMINDMQGIYIEEGTTKAIEIEQGEMLCDIYVKNSEVTKEALMGWSRQLEEYRGEE